MEYGIALGVLAIMVCQFCLSVQITFVSNQIRKLVDQQDAQRANQDDPRY